MAASESFASAWSGTDHVRARQVFFPYVALYLGAAFLQGGAGTGSNGLLNNMRSWLWIPISQSAYRTISLDLFSHVLDLDLKFHLMCAPPPPSPPSPCMCAGYELSWQNG